MRFKMIVLLVAVAIVGVSVNSSEAQLFRRGCCNNQVYTPVVQSTCCQNAASNPKVFRRMMPQRFVSQPTCCSGMTSMAVTSSAVNWMPSATAMPMQTYAPAPIYSTPIQSGCCGQSVYASPVFNQGAIVWNGGGTIIGSGDDDELDPEDCDVEYINCIATCSNCTGADATACQENCACMRDVCTGINTTGCADKPAPLCVSSPGNIGG